MNDLHEPLDHIRAFAPVPDESDAYEYVLALVLGTETPAPVRAGRRRLHVAAAVTTIALLGAGGVAAAAGVTPHRAWQLIFASPDTPHGTAYAADPSTARKVFAVPGPHGREFAGWTIDNHVGWQCVSTFFEPAGTTELAARRFLSAAGGCTLSPGHDDSLFGDGTGGYTERFYDRVSFVYPSGRATHADLVVSNGASYPVRIEDGWLGGWFTRAQVPLGSTATIVAYGSDGTRLGSWDVLDQRGCPAGRLC